MKALRARQKLGKYVIERKLGDGGFSIVYEARDTIEGIRVALKVPHAHLLTGATMEDFRKEVRMVARLEHPNILPLKNAQFIDNLFVIVSASGEMTLEDRMARKLPLDTAFDFAGQMLSALSYAHSQRIIHCDIKPDNFILFENNRLRLTDFGVAKVAQRTLRASGAGTLGYMAPEQAMGRPSFRSDVFALALVLYRMFSGHLPEYPFRWPPPGYRELQRKVSPGMLSLLQRSMDLVPQKRFADAQAMLATFARVKSHRGGRTGSSRKSAKSSKRSVDFKTIQRRQFIQEFGRILDASHQCPACEGPVSEAMQVCPWCAKRRLAHEGTTDFPKQCTRCRRGMKLDWHYCPWCYGPGVEHSDREYSDIRYTARCQNADCERKLLMPFMKYCPWCRRKVRRKWKIPESKSTCRHCGWGVAAGYWSHCPWCSAKLNGQ